MAMGHEDQYFVNSVCSLLNGIGRCRTDSAASSPPVSASTTRNSCELSRVPTRALVKNLTGARFIFIRSLTTHDTGTRRDVCDDSSLARRFETLSEPHMDVICTLDEFLYR